MVEKRLPWGYAKELQHIRWSPEELNKKLLEDIPEEEKHLKFLLILLYLAGARLQEIIPLNEEGQHRPSLRWRDIYFERVGDDDTKWNLCIECRILKQDRHKESHQKWMNKRKTIIPCREEHYDFPLVEFVYNYLEQDGYFNSHTYLEVSDRKHNTSEQEFFEGVKSMGSVEQLCNKYLKCNPHYLRHLKFYHLSNEDNLTPQMLKEIGSWKSGEMCLHYSQATQKDIQRRLWGEG